jgi:hypothetical protein
MGAPDAYRAAAQPMPQEPSRGGSFLGTAAAAAAGVIGGSLLLDSIRSMTGHRHGGAGLADPAAAAGRDSGSPWGGTGGGDLARQAGLDDVGRGAAGGESSGERHRLLDQAVDDVPDDDFADNADSDFDDGFDLGGDGAD